METYICHVRMTRHDSADSVMFMTAEIRAMTLLSITWGGGGGYRLGIGPLAAVDTFSNSPHWILMIIFKIGGELN